MATDDSSSLQARERAAMAWGAASVASMIGMFGMAFFGSRLDIPPIVKVGVMILPMPLLIAAARVEGACGNFSPALRRHNSRVLILLFGYVVALCAAIWAHRAWQPEGVLAWGIAILPSVPLLFFIWSMGAYLAEEKDEYLRNKAIMASLWATGILLAAATCYGFLESFELVPHVQGWAAVPVWAIGLRIGNLMVRRAS